MSILNFLSSLSYVLLFISYQLQFLILIGSHRNRNPIYKLLEKLQPILYEFNIILVFTICLHYTAFDEL